MTALREISGEPPPLRGGERAGRVAVTAAFGAADRAQHFAPEPDLPGPGKTRVMSRALGAISTVIAADRPAMLGREHHPRRAGGRLAVAVPAPLLAGVGFAATSLAPAI